MSNNQTIKNLRVKNSGTSVSQVLPIGADAVNVELANRRNLQETIGNIDSRTDGSITNNLEVLSSAIQTLDNIKADTAMIGSPLVAGAASQMIDTSHIYVYTGSESGYTAGNWYYHNGTNWVSGGVYNSTAVETDKTLKVENVAADSRAAGNIVLVSQTQPVAASNKIWIDPDASEIEIPTMDDLSEQGFSQDARIALLDCFAHVAWVDEHGQDYYDALEDALYPETGLVSISAVFTQGSAVIYPSTPLNDLKAYLVVTGFYNDGTSRTITDYSLSGTLEVGTNTITVAKDGKTTTFTVTASQPYWDYEWYASSMALPEGMTAYRYNFTDEPGAMFVANPNLDFDYVGNCRLMVEAKWYCYNETVTTGEFIEVIKDGNNPQLLALNKTVNGNKSGSRIVGHANGQSDEMCDIILLTGNNTDYFGQKDNVYHTFDLIANGNDCSVSIPDLEFTVSGTGFASQYNTHTGIYSAAATGDSVIHIKGLFIKSIKFKKL